MQTGEKTKKKQKKQKKKDIGSLLSAFILKVVL